VEQDQHLNLTFFVITKIFSHLQSRGNTTSTGGFVGRLNFSNGKTTWLNAQQTAATKQIELSP
jgi:hypothetical protein